MDVDSEAHLQALGCFNFKTVRCKGAYRERKRVGASASSAGQSDEKGDGTSKNKDKDKDSQSKKRAKKADKAPSLSKTLDADRAKLVEHKLLSGGAKVSSADHKPRRILPDCFGADKDYSVHRVFIRKDPNGVGIRFKVMDGKLVVRGFKPTFDGSIDIRVNDVVMSVNHLDSFSQPAEKLAEAMRWKELTFTDEAAALPDIMVTVRLARLTREVTIGPCREDTERKERASREQKKSARVEKKKVRDAARVKNLADKAARDAAKAAWAAANPELAPRAASSSSSRRPPVKAPETPEPGKTRVVPMRDSSKRGRAALEKQQAEEAEAAAAEEAAAVQTKAEEEAVVAAAAAESPASMVVLDSGDADGSTSSSAPATVTASVTAPVPASVTVPVTLPAGITADTTIPVEIMNDDDNDDDDDEDDDDEDDDEDDYEGEEY
jgi:hypothetical protein